jgi:large subunit ribosomal protein L25
MAATLRARPREGAGKGAARRLRRAGQIPANLYGHNDANRSLVLDALELEKLLHSIIAETTVVQLRMDGGGTADVLIREIQQHPFKPDILHVDFLALHAGEPIRLQVPVRLLGTPSGVREEGGILDQVLHEIEIECLPRDIPEAAELDVSELAVGEQVRVRDVSLPRVQVLADPDLPVASVLPPAVPLEEEAAAGEEGAGEAAGGEE